METMMRESVYFMKLSAKDLEWLMTNEGKLKESMKQHFNKKITEEKNISHHCLVYIKE